MVVRLDDVNPNTNLEDLHEQISILNEYFESIIIGVNLFGQSCDSGSVYPNLPLKDNPTPYFFNVDKMMDRYDIEDIMDRDLVEVVSHGLVHAMHTKMSRDAVQMSVLTSCAYLDTKKFIPPFNAVNDDVISVCKEHGIEIICNNDKYNWKSLESDHFDAEHSDWYYHPWRLDSEGLRLVLESI